MNKRLDMSWRNDRIFHDETPEHWSIQIGWRATNQPAKPIQQVLVHVSIDLFSSISSDLIVAQDGEKKYWPRKEIKCRLITESMDLQTLTGSEKKISQQKRMRKILQEAHWSLSHKTVVRNSAALNTLISIHERN